MRSEENKKTSALPRGTGDSVDALVAEWRRERPDLDPSPVAILGRLHRISARLQRRIETWLEPLDLTLHTYGALPNVARCHRKLMLNPRC